MALLDDHFNGWVEHDMRPEARTDDEPDESEDENPEAVIQPRGVSEHRRAQISKFNDWYLKQAEVIQKEEAQAIEKTVDIDTKSSRDLFRLQGSSVIVDDPRDYQLELFERAKKENTIAVLDTGSGKTLIAVLLLKHTLDQELEARALGKRPRISFFVVDCVTLVFQQHAVLECNLDQKIERFCGEMGCDLWNKELWVRHFQENMVIVCTAQILLDCLGHSFISMDQINLLIFDEAHHAKKAHAYALIIKDFYVPDSDTSPRPKVFGMTASPVDAKTDPVDAARDLEAMLNCQIATVSDLALLQKTVHKPQEETLRYSALRPVMETKLYSELKSSFENEEILSRPFRAAKDASSELGSWCADQIWRYVLDEEENVRLESKTQRLLRQKENSGQAAQNVEAKLARLRDAREVVSNHAFSRPRLEESDLSSKVILLCHYLRERFENPTEDKCIVFVTKRCTARVLSNLFQHLGTPYLRVGVLIGSGSSNAVDLKVSFHQQTLTLSKFRKGIINCLFATSIAEEGLDVPDCNLVIRFDLFSTTIQYIQSRGRARHANSKFVVMTEEGNLDQAQTLRDVATGEATMRSFCEMLPAERLLRGNEHDLDLKMAQELERKVYKTKEGAKLTYASSLGILAHFVSCLNADSGVVTKPVYIIAFRNGQYISEVVLPESSPIRSAVGQPTSRKSLAKRSAAFAACFLLWQGKYIDENLLPVFRKRLPAMRNAQLALNVKSKNSYAMRVKPNIWAESVGAAPTYLYATVIELADTRGFDWKYQPLILLTREKLPNLPEFPIHFRSGSSSNTILRPLKKPLHLDSADINLINTFTLRIFADVFNKWYEPDPSQIPFWIAPGASAGPDVQSAREALQWDVLHFVQDHTELAWDESSPDEFFEDRFIVDPGDGGRRFFTRNVRPDLKPLDAVPEDVPSAKKMNNILQYSSSLWKASRAKITFREDQPVVEAEKIQHRRNWLDKMSDEEQTAKTTCFICIQPLKVSALPSSIAAMALIFPAILFRIDSYLISREACKMLDLDIRPDLALEALTKDSVNTEEHQKEQIHFQRGMGKNYERLEFLGDCFLKMATSISLFTQCPDNDEFEYHVRRMLLVCNKNLFNTAVKLELFEYIRTRGFSRRVWYPQEPKLLKGKGFNKGKENLTHSLGDKTIADVCEAIIGAALLSHERGKSVDEAVRAVTRLVNHDDHRLSKWEDYYKLYEKPRYQLAPATHAQIELTNQLRWEHDYQFQHPRLARSAFQHPSYPFCWEEIPSYQRLEFLGDSLLDMVCINFIYERYPDKDPQWLTEHKMAMVSNRFLGALSVKLGFHRHLRHNGSSMLMSQIKDYVEDVTEAEQESNGSPDYWIHIKRAPKCLPDIVEAYIGAVFVDSEFDFAQVERFFDVHIKPFFEDMHIYDTFANNHPTTFLTNLLSLTLGCCSFRLMSKEIPNMPGLTSADGQSQVLAAIIIHDEVVAEGRASSSKYAKVKASENALKKLQGLARSDFRQNYRCDCRVSEETDHDRPSKSSKTDNNLDIGSAI